MAVTLSSDFFGIYKQVLSPKLCTTIIERFESDPRKVRGMVGDHQYNPEVKDCTEIDLHTAKEGWEDVENILSKTLKNSLELYMQKWGRAFKGVEITHETFRMTRYNPGQQYNWHSDNMGGSTSRVITAQWYLNTVKEAGATEFMWMNRKINPVQGQVLLFPVGWPFFYRETAPVSGPKYTITTQLHQRRLKVDTGIQAKDENQAEAT